MISHAKLYTTNPSIAAVRVVGSLLLGGIFGTAGCGPSSVDPALVAEYRGVLSLKEEPSEAQAVAEVREALLGESSADDHDDHAHDEHAHDDHAHDEHAHDEHAHDEHAHDEHAHDDHAHDEHAHDSVVASDRQLEVTMVGTVGGLPNPAKQSHPDFPFEKGKAIVFLADPAAAAHLADEGHQHAPGEECAFCEAHAEDSSAMLAVVRFHDEAGKIVGVDVRDLFDLKGNETVVVQGLAKIEAGMLVVDAKGLYVRR